MSVVVFSGPTVDAGEIASLPGVRGLPPVSYGDVYRAVALYRPRAVAIIDGYFNQVPAVWHKEILWAISRGVGVFGAASMGALRAAELDRFGMRGVGEIYAAYRDGRFAPYDDPFDRDDEVAVLHGPAETGYRAISEALVNIRATLAAAARAGVIDGPARDRLAALAGRRFYAERSFETLWSDAAGEGVDPSLLAALEAWLPENRVDQKALDARLLLDRLADADQAHAEHAGFDFAHTTLWDNAVRDFERVPPPISPVLDELRLLGPDYFALRDEVIEESLGAEPSNPDEAGAPSAPENWFREPLRRAAHRQFRQSAPHDWIAVRMLARLEASGELDALERRADDKRLKLAGTPCHAAELSELELLQLMDWYFGEQLGEEIPEDLAGYAEMLGGLEIDAFQDLVLREYAYRHGDQ